MFPLSERLHAEIMHVFMTLTKLLCHLCLLYVTVDIQTWSFLLGCHCSRLSVAKKGGAGGGGRWIRCCEQRQTRVCQSPSVAVVILWLFENCLNMCKLARNVKQKKFLLKLFVMEPLVWIPSLSNFKGDKREGCKTQLRIRKKKAPETTCACLKPLIPLTTFYCSFSLLFSPSQSCRRMPELRTAQTGFLFF